MDKYDEFFEQHGITDGKLTPEQAAQLMELSAKGETDALSSETGGAPDAALEGEQQQEGLSGNEPSLDDLTADNAVVLARDGKHTIPFERLQQTREEVRTLKGRLAESEQWQTKYQSAQQELDALRAQAQQRADAGMAPTDADRQVAAYDAAVEAGLDPDELMGDFSAEAIVKGMARIADQRVQAAVAEALKPFAGFLEQQQLEKQVSAKSAHDQAIYAAHPNLDSMVESQEFQAWMDRQVEAAPNFMKDGIRAGFEKVLSTGTASEVIELFDAYTGKQKTVTPPPANARQAAQQAIAATKATPPISLSDIPGAAGGAASEFEVLASLSPNDLSNRLASMPPEKVEAFLNSRM